MTTTIPPGLQPERTALAWSRTALAMLATGTLVAKLGAANTDPLTAVAGGLLLLTSLLTWRTGRHRVRADPTSGLTSSAANATALITVLTGISAALVAASSILH